MHIHLPIAQGIHAQLNAFLSPQERTQRPVEPLEQPPLQMMASYLRNIEYTPNNTRSLAALEECLDYLVKQIVPRMINSQGKQRNEVALFLENRLKAIRCEYVVQGMLVPAAAVKLLRVELLLRLGQQDLMWQQQSGLDELLHHGKLSGLGSELTPYYDEALIYAMFSTSKDGLASLLGHHPRILDSTELADLFQLRLNMENGNYEAYFHALRTSPILVRAILIRHLTHMRKQAAVRIAKAYRDVFTPQIASLLLLQPTQLPSELLLPAKSLPALIQSIAVLQWGGLSQEELLSMVT